MISWMRWVAVVLVLASCGPIAYVGQVTLKADDAVEAARVSEADKYSPYWWTRATQYLYMAREVAAHADYQGANHFGRLATEAAEKAKAESDDPARRAIVNQSVAKPADATTPGQNGKVAPAKDPRDDIAPAKDPAP
jgi:sRNA-binding protein